MELNMFSFPEVTYEIQLTENLHFQLGGKYPNWFHRKMCQLLLGWKFKTIGKN
jgi:hypothetical protein